MQPLIILGAGGHAKVLVELIRRLGWEVRGVATRDLPAGASFLGHSVLGDDSAVEALPPGEVLLINGIGSIGSLERRRMIFDFFKARGFSFASLIHPTAVVADGIKLGEGVQIMAGALLQPGVSVGDNTLINTGAIIDHDGCLGKHVHVSPGVALSGNVVIGDGVHIGTGASVIQGKKIGPNGVVGAGAVVVRDVEEQMMVFGVPARVIRTMRDWTRVLIPPTLSIREAIRIIDAEALRIALVVEDDGRLLGCVTDGDIRRGILRNLDLDLPIDRVMNRDPVVARKEESGERLMQMMLERNLYHLPVVDEQGRVLRLEMLENFIPRTGKTDLV